MAYELPMKQLLPVFFQLHLQPRVYLRTFDCSYSYYEGAPQVTLFFLD